MFPYCISISSLLFSVSSYSKQIMCSLMDGSGQEHMYSSHVDIMDLGIDMHGEYT